MADVTLSTGQTVTVHPVPPFALTAVEARLPIDADAAAETVQQQMLDRERSLREAAFLIALEGITVPEDWQFPKGLLYADVQPRASEDGRLLDYIEYGLLQTPQDIERVQDVMYGSAVTTAEVEAAEAMFCPDRGREAAAEDPPG